MMDCENEVDKLKSVCHLTWWKEAFNVEQSYFCDKYKELSLQKQDEAGKKNVSFISPLNMPLR